MIKRLIQRVIVSLVLLLTFAAGAHATGVKDSTAKDAAKQTAPATQVEKKSSRTSEQLYLDGITCLSAPDIDCAQVAWALINPASPYSKLLEGQIAAAKNDFDTALRLLIPLQAESKLLPQAYGSLHVTLAQAYERQENPLRALDQYSQASPYIDPNSLEDAIWKLVSAQPKEVLLQMRGAVNDSAEQGWIDLALAVSSANNRAKNIAQWHLAYPEQVISAELLAKITQGPGGAVAAAPPPASMTNYGKIALLLPLKSKLYGSAALAVQAGFMAAYAADTTPSKPEIQVYETGELLDTPLVYRKAVAEGADFIVGPLTRDEVTLIASAPIQVPTLALNQPYENGKAQDNLTMLTLSAEAEARQIANLVRNRGLQTAQVVVADSALARRIAKAFVDQWQAQDGKISAQIEIPNDPNKFAAFKSAAANPADMIFLAASATRARQARPYLDAAVPTYATSYIYDGTSGSLQNKELSAIHFVDIPWILVPDSSEFALFRASAAKFSGAELQRLFALGLDAYRILPKLQGKSSNGPLLEGATGNISWGENGVLTRELPLAQFRPDGVALESDQ
jgi:hypothetical protein